MENINIVGQRPIDAMGFGIIPKLVMLDKDLTVEAKAIYSYICSYAGAGAVAFPSVSLICDHLGMATKRFMKHRKLLEDKGYIKIIQERGENGKGFAKNKYYLMPSCNFIQEEKKQAITEKSVYGQNDHTQKKQATTEKSVYGHFVHTQNVHTQNVYTQNDHNNNNSFKNNSYKNNSKQNKKNEKEAVAVSAATPVEKPSEATEQEEMQQVLAKCSPALQEAIIKFIEYRKSGKYPMTANSVDALLERLMAEFETDQDRIKSLQTSRINGWRDVYSNNRNASSSAQKQKSEAVSEKSDDWRVIPQELMEKAKQAHEKFIWRGADVVLGALKYQVKSAEELQKALTKFAEELDVREKEYYAERSVDNARISNY